MFKHIYKYITLIIVELYFIIGFFVLYHHLITYHPFSCDFCHFFTGFCLEKNDFIASLYILITVVVTRSQ